MRSSTASFIGTWLLVLAGASVAASAADETARINAWLDAKYEEQLDLSPMARSYAGEKKDYDKIDDMSEAAGDRALEWQRKSVEELKAKFDRAKLPPDAQLSYDLWIYQYEDAASLAKFKRNDYAFNQLYGPHTRLAQFLMQIHRVDEPSDMDAYVARIGGIARAQLQLLDIAKRNAAAGSRVPRFSYETMIPQARALITGAPFAGEGNSAVWTDVQTKVDGLVKAGKIDAAKADAYKASARKALLEQWQPAYDQVIAWFESEVPKADAVATGVGKNPNGKAYYEAMLVNSTTTRLTAEQVHQIGLDEVARIKGEMEQIKQKVGFQGTLQEFFKFVREDDRFYYPNTDEGRQAYIEAATAHIAFMKQQLPKYFGILPKADVIVKRVESYREVAGAPQHYYFSTPDGSRPGVFYAHLLDMRSMPIPQLEVITYHEGLPGHHMNFAIARELTGHGKAGEGAGGVQGSLLRLRSPHDRDLACDPSRDRHRAAFEGMDRGAVDRVLRREFAGSRRPDPCRGAALHRHAGTSNRLQDRHDQDGGVAQAGAGSTWSQVRHSRLPRHDPRSRPDAARPARSARRPVDRGARGALISMVQACKAGD
jgi:uncharacterized protein (DUF885 family)